MKTENKQQAQETIFKKYYNKYFFLSLYILLFAGVIIFYFYQYTQKVDDKYLENHNIFAVVDGKQISENEFSDNVKLFLDNYDRIKKKDKKVAPLDDKSIDLVVQSVLNKYFVILYGFKKYNISLSEDGIKETIAKDDVFKTEGRFDKRIFESFLKYNNISENDYIKILTDNLMFDLTTNKINEDRLNVNDIIAEMRNKVEWKVNVAMVDKYKIQYFSILNKSTDEIKN